LVSLYRYYGDKKKIKSKTFRRTTRWRNF
jgi:hypothetical protein